MNSILELQNIGYQNDWGSEPLLDDISFTVSRGDRIAILGASGSGKTTLLRLLNRLIDPTSGQIFFNQQPLKDQPIIQLRQQVGLVLQEPKLLGMRVWDALAYPLVLQNISTSAIQDQVHSWCNRLKIPDEWLERNELQLSVGQRQLIAIARTLILQPQILLLDEPTSALDLGLSTFLMKTLEELSQQQSMTILMVNHHLETAHQFSQRVLYLTQGKLTQNSASSDLNWKALKAELSQSDQEENW